MTTARPAGLIDYTVAFPQGRVTLAQMCAWSGLSEAEVLEITHCREFPVLGPDEYAWELAVDAAAELLRRTDTDVQAISRVIYTGSGYWDTPAWSPAAKVADELGITEAHCFELTNFCNALSLGIQVAVDGLRPGADERVLVVSAERFGGTVDRHDPDSKPLFNFGDAAAAVLVGSAEGCLTYLGSAARTDPAWCDYFSGDYHESGVYTRRRGHRPGLGDAYQENFLTLIERTLKEVGRDLGDVRYLLMNQNDRNVQDKLLATLGLPPERSVYNHEKLGHMGCADALIALRDITDADQLADGDLVLLATSGLGFSWSVTALEYRARAS